MEIIPYLFGMPRMIGTLRRKIQFYFFASQKGNGSVGHNVYLYCFDILLKKKIVCCRRKYNPASQSFSRLLLTYKKNLQSNRF